MFIIEKKQKNKNLINFDIATRKCLANNNQWTFIIN